MVGYLDNGFNVLTSELSPPPGFLNVSSPYVPGKYLFGYHNFQVRDMQVANIFHRSVAGRHEDFVLGILSVLLIAVLSEIVQVILMRTREKRVSRNGLHTAFLLDEVTHFRNVFALVNTRPRRGELSSKASRALAWSSLTILSIGIALLAAEVVAVYLTQTIRVYTAEYQYNLRGVQPAGTSSEMATQIDKLSAKKTCVTPSMKDSNQTREYSIAACVTRDYVMQLAELDDVATYVEVGSWYHKAGSDHIIKYGITGVEGQHTISTRASILQSTLGISKGLLFRVVDTDDQDHALYLQNYFMYTAMQWSCNRTSVKCEDLVNSFKAGQAKKETRRILLWRNSDKGVEEDVPGDIVGLVTRFEVGLRDPFRSLQTALKVFASSAIVEEVEGPGMYVSMKDGTEGDAIEALVSEEGRIAGALMLGLAFALLLALLVALRMLLKPVSLAQIARSSIEEEREVYFDGVDDIDAEYVGAGPDGLPSTMSRGPERDIVEAEVDDYASALTLSSVFR